MKKWLLSFAMLFLIYGFSSAQNLVPNPGFESYNNTFCGIMTFLDFEQTIQDWKNPTFASPSVYFTFIDPSCYNFQPDSQYGGPIGLKGTQLPRTGEIMIGIWVYTIPDLNQRQYLQVQLTTPMVSGHAYIVSYYASLGDYIEKAINNLGAHLSVNPISASNDGPLNVVPQILENNFIDDVSGWTLISDTIVAEENYNYLTIGNFYNDDLTNTMSNPTYSGEPGTYGAYYFIDDVGVEETIITKTNDLNENSFEIFPNPIQNEINISIPENENDVLVKLYNSQGIELLSKRSANQRSIRIDSSLLPAGAYFIQLKSDQESFVRKILKY